MARLTEREIREDLQAFARQLQLDATTFNKIINEVARTYSYTHQTAKQALEATGIAKEQELAYIREAFLRRLDALESSYTSYLLEQAQKRALPAPKKKSILDRLDEAVLGPPGSPFYDFGSFLIGKKGDD